MRHHHTVISALRRLLNVPLLMRVCIACSRQIREMESARRIAAHRRKMVTQPIRFPFSVRATAASENGNAGYWRGVCTCRVGNRAARRRMANFTPPKSSVLPEYELFVLVKAMTDF